MTLTPSMILQVDPNARGTREWFAGWPAFAARIGADCELVDATTRLSETVLQSKQLLVTTTAEDLREAGHARLPVIYVPSGFDIGVPADFGATCTVRSGTNFRQDVTLDALVAAATDLVPSLVLPATPFSCEVGELLTGAVAHVGHAGAKITPSAIGFDAFRQGAGDQIADPRDMWCAGSHQFDSVLLTPSWHEIMEPRQVLTEALRILVPGGLLVIGAEEEERLPDLEALACEAGAESAQAGTGYAIVANPRRRAARIVMPPPPEVSVIIVGEVHQPEDLEPPRLQATIRAAHASLCDVPHEILVLLRHRPDADALAALRELALEMPECQLEEDLSPLPMPERFERLRQDARSPYLLVLASGALPRDAALRELYATARESHAEMAIPRCIDPTGQNVRAERTPGSCVLVRADLWPNGKLSHTAYCTPELWNVWADELQTTVVDRAVVVTDGWAGRSVFGTGQALIGFDAALRARSVSVSGRENTDAVLVVILRTMGDCILTTAILDAIALRHAAASITVLTERRFGWIFRHHPAIDEVLLAPDLDDDDMFRQEQELVLHVLEERTFGHLVMLSDRLDNVPYFRAGSTFLEFYATIAGVPDAGRDNYRIVLSPDDYAAARSELSRHGITSDYAVIHTKAGWPERTPPASLYAAICAALVAEHALPVVVVGGPGEEIADDNIVNLAGAIPAEVSAAVIAGARLFVGPDSGSMHLASAFDVPTLGLYGGTSMRLVPPQATRAIAVQAPTSCPRPCGSTPCAEQECGAHGHHFAHVRPHLADLLRGDVEIREWFGGDPATFVSSPEGAAIAQTGPVPFAKDHPLAVVRRVPPIATHRMARQVLVAWRRDPVQTAAQEGYLRDMRQGERGEHSILPSLQSNRIDVLLDVACHHGLAIQCLLSGQHSSAVRYLAAALADVAGVLTSDGPATGRVRREMRALRHTLACFDWPRELDRLFARLLECAPDHEVGGVPVTP